MSTALVLSSPVSAAGPDALLDQLTLAFAKGTRCYRDHLLETGRLAQSYILARKAEGHSRSAAVQAIGGRLAEIAGKPVNVNRLAAAAAAVAALHRDGVDFSAMPFRLIVEFIPLLKRDRQTEAWAILPGLEESARSLFRKAAESRLDVKAVHRAVKLLLDGDTGDTPEAPRGERDPLADLAAMPPAGLAETLARIFEQHTDPAAVFAALARSLNWKPAWATAFAQGLLAAGAIKSANALLLVLKNAQPAVPTI